MALKIFNILVIFLYVYNNVLVFRIAAEGNSNGSYIIMLDKLEKIKEVEDVFKTHITFEVKNNKAVIKGQMDQLIELNEEYKLLVVFYYKDKADGTFKKLILIPSIGVCTFMRSIYKKYLYTTLKNYSNAPDPDICPVTRNTYVVEDYPAESVPLQKYLKPGYFLTNISLLYNNEELLKYVVHAHVKEELST